METKQGDVFSLSVCCFKEQFVPACSFVWLVEDALVSASRFRSRLGMSSFTVLLLVKICKLRQKENKVDWSV